MYFSPSRELTSGFGESFAAIASSNASAASPSPAYSGGWDCPPHRQAEWAVLVRGRGVSPIPPNFTELCRSSGSMLRNSCRLSPNMIRSNINETAVYIQVRTVVWEDGAYEKLCHQSVVAHALMRAAFTLV
jgi:hypothetical protein